MAGKLYIRNHSQESRQFVRRTAVSLSIVGVLALLLMGRIAYLQVVQRDLYATLSEENRVKILPIEPSRGLIFDRNGVLLAENRPTFSLELVPEEVPELDQTVAELGELVTISDTDLERFHRTIGRKRRFESVSLRLRLSEEEVARFAVNQYRFPGVEVAARLTRHYPLGPLMAHAVGYVGRIDDRDLAGVDASNYAASQYIGKVGVESFYEGTLHGTVGYQKVETTAGGRIVRVLERKPPIGGSDLYLTIDSRLQAAVTEAMGDNQGAVVAIEPSTGAVLALVSTPSFDPNPFATSIDAKSYRELLQAPSRPLFNRASRGQYPPGSTIKPFMALAGLYYGVVTPGTTIYDPGWFRLPNARRAFRCWRHGGHGAVNMHRSIVQSCDTYYYRLGSSLGVDRIHAFLTRFGFGRDTGIDLPDERPGLIPSQEWKKTKIGQPWFPGESVVTAIGQGYVLTTPLQLADATATLAEKGHRVTPHLLHAAHIPGEGYRLYREEYLPAITLANSGDWERVFKAMEDVVHSSSGTARRISTGITYHMAGKTGTAQVAALKAGQSGRKDVRWGLRDHALFIAFAPVEQPRIALAVIVEHGVGGSVAAAPVARAVLDAYLKESGS